MTYDETHQTPEPINRDASLPSIPRSVGSYPFILFISQLSIVYFDMLMSKKYVIFVFHPLLRVHRRDNTNRAIDTDTS